MTSEKIGVRIYCKDKNGREKHIVRPGQIAAHGISFVYGSLVFL